MPLASAANFALSFHPSIVIVCSTMIADLQKLSNDKNPACGYVFESQQISPTS